MSPSTSVIDVNCNLYAKYIRLWFIIVTSNISKLFHESEDKFIDKKNFLICKTCLWCASCMANPLTIKSCPSCGRNEVESMPIADYESYKLDCDYIHDLALGFWPNYNGDGLVK
jgi:hypothetical protein